MATRKGVNYMRTTREKTPVLYGPNESFPIGGSKTLRSSDKDVAVVIAAGITLHEALKAYDELKKDNLNIRVVDLFSIQPIDAKTLIECSGVCSRRVLTVEDHYAHGGLGDAVAAALAGEGIAIRKLAIREIPRSGEPAELLDYYGISARSIASVVRELCSGAPR